MKRTFATIFLGVLLAFACAAQTLSSLTTFSTPQQPNLTTVVTSGAQGSTPLCYWLVAVYSAGKSAPAGPLCTAVANATLSSTNFNTVNWVLPTTPLQAVSSFDLLRTANITPPTGACACAVATGISSAAVTQTDQSNSLNAYTVATLSASGTVQLPTTTGGIGVVIDCGPTTGNAACANTNSLNTGHAYYGSATLASNAAIITFGVAFTATTTYECVANDVTTRANPVQMVATSTTTATITNTTGASDVISWMCLGR